MGLHVPHHNPHRFHPLVQGRKCHRQGLGHEQEQGQRLGEEQGQRLGEGQGLVHEGEG